MAPIKKRKETQYDYWWDVPVMIVGTPNPEAVRAMWDSVRDFELTKEVEEEILRRKERPSTTANIHDDRGIDKGQISPG